MDISYMITILRSGGMEQLASYRYLIADALEELDERVAIMEEGCGYRTRDGLREYRPEKTKET